MPKTKPSKRNKLSRWDDELEEYHSSGKDERKARTGLHNGRKERIRSKRVDSDVTMPGVDQSHWLEVKPVASGTEVPVDEPGFLADDEPSLSLADIRELATRLKLLSEQTSHIMQNVRACGIDFGQDMDQQFLNLNKKRSELDLQIEQQAHLYNQESKKLQQSLGRDSAQVISEMIRYETKKQSTYQYLYFQFKRLFSEMQAFHEGIEGLAWNLDQCN